MQRQTGTGTQRNAQRVGRLRDLQQQGIGAVQCGKKRRLTRTGGKALQKGAAHSGDVPAAAGGAAQFKQMQPQPVAAVLGGLLHQTGLAQRGNDAMQGAFGQVGTPCNLPQRHRCARLSKDFKDLYRLFYGLYPSACLLHHVQFLLVWFAKE